MADKESRKVRTVEEVNTIFSLIKGCADYKERTNTNVDLYGKEKALATNGFFCLKRQES